MYATFGLDGQLDAVAKSTDGGFDWAYVTLATMSRQPLGIYALSNNPHPVCFTLSGVLYGFVRWRATVTGN